MINSPLNYTGNKFRVLKQIIPLLNSDKDTFCDIFCGSGLVSLNSNYKKIVMNDNFKEIIEIIEMFIDKDSEHIIKEVDKIINKYGFTDTFRKGGKAYPELQHEGLSKFNKIPFLKLRNEYSNKKRPLLLFALTIFSFNHYIRFNGSGVYNLPVGKVDFSKSLREKTKKYSEALKTKKITLSNKDFRDRALYKKDALYYFDPPYLITSAPYNTEWDINKEKELLELLDELNIKGKKFALSNVFRSNGKENSLLIKWSKKYNIHRIYRTYTNSNYQKKNLSEAEEVLITNY